MLILKLFPNRTLTQTLILTPKKANEKSADEYFSFSFYSVEVENFRGNSHYLSNMRPKFFSLTSTYHS